MPRLLSVLGVVVAACAVCLGQAADTKTQAAPQLPTPSIYPKSWELKFAHSKPARIVVELPDRANPVAYWYLPYTVTNNTGEERMFLPLFQLVGENGKVTRSSIVPDAVINAIRVQQGNKFIQSTTQLSGELRLGPAEAKYGVAVWPEPALEMGQFSILVGGLSGETQKVKSDSGDEVLLRKTLELSFVIYGDEAYPGQDQVHERPSKWIMR